MSFKIEELDQLQRKLNDLERRAQELSGEHRVSFAELFPSSFMQRNTRYPSIEAMVEASPWRVETQADFAAIPDDPWDEFVRGATSFGSWKEMMAAAAREYAARKLSLR